jgi:hypothetical protein
MNMDLLIRKECADVLVKKDVLIRKRCADESRKLSGNVLMKYKI